MIRSWHLLIIKSVVWIYLFSPLQSISVWLLTSVSLISSLRVDGIPGISIWGNSYTPWALSNSRLVLNWCCVLTESFAKSIDQKGCWPSAVQLMTIVYSCGANMYGTGHGSDTRTNMIILCHIIFNLMFLLTFCGAHLHSHYALNKQSSSTTDRPCTSRPA